MVRFLCILAVLLSPTWAASLSATGRVPLRPPDGIYDPGTWLKEPMRAAMVRKILEAREKGDSGVFVVVLEDGPDQADALAARLGEEWGKGGLWGVVLHRPGEPGFPKFYAGLSRSPGWTEEQKIDFDQSLKRAVEKVAQGAATLSGERQQVARGTGDLADELGYLALVMARIDHHNAQVPGNRGEAGGVSSGGGVFGFLAKFAIIAVVALLLLILYVIFRSGDEEDVEESSEGFLFPQTEARKRFRAPWAGGGNVLIDFRKRG